MIISDSTTGGGEYRPARDEQGVKESTKTKDAFEEEWVALVMEEGDGNWREL